MALTIINEPSKQKGVKVSTWVACHNPVVFKIETDAIPNTRDTAENYTSVAEFRGFAVFTLSATSNPEWYRPFLKISVTGSTYSGEATVTRFDPSTLEVYTNLPYQGDDTGTIIKYYDAYLIDVLPTIGLPASHIYTASKPEQQGFVQSIPPVSGVSVFDLQKQLQRDVNSKNDLTQVSFPNDLNAFTGFRVSYRESYADLEGLQGNAIDILGYADEDGFVRLSLTSVQGLQTGGFVLLSGFTDAVYNNSVVRIRQVVSSTEIDVDLTYDAYLTLNGSEQVQVFSTNLQRLETSYTDDTTQYWAVNASQAVGSFFGTNLVDYVASSPTELAEFMTIFERRQVFPDQFEDFTIIVDTPLLDALGGYTELGYRVEQLDVNGDVLEDRIEVINMQGEGVYRLPSAGNPNVSVENLTLSVTGSSIQLDWDELTGLPLFSNYEIWRSTSPNVVGTGQLLDTSATNSYEDTSIETGETYYYRVRGVGAFASGFSNEVSATFSFVEFQTEWDTGIDGLFTASIAFSDSQVATWVLPDGTSVTSNSLVSNSASFDGLVNSILIQADDFSLVTDLVLEDNKLIGTADVSDLTGTPNVNFGDSVSLSNSISTLISPINGFGDLGIRGFLGTTLNVNVNGTLSADLSSTLETIIASGSGNITILSCPSLETLNASSFRYINGSIRPINGSPNLSTISLNNSVPNTLTVVDIVGTDITSLDFTNFTGAFTNFEANGNSLLTSFTPPDSGTFTGLLNLRSNGFTAVDLSNLTINTSSCAVGNDGASTSVIFGAGSPTGNLNGLSSQYSTVNFGTLAVDGLSNIDFSGNTGTFPTDQFLIDLDNLSTSASGTIDISGGAIPAPGAPGLAARTSLISKGWTVINN